MCRRWQVGEHKIQDCRLHRAGRSRAGARMLRTKEALCRRLEGRSSRGIEGKRVCVALKGETGRSDCSDTLYSQLGVLSRCRDSRI